MNKRQQQSQLRRERILNAASYCFSYQGFAKTSVAEIAARAGVSKGLVFVFFKNKRELFEHVLKQALKEWTQTTENYAANSNDSLLKLEQLFTGVFDYIHTNPMIAGVLLASNETANKHFDPYYPLIRRSHNRWRRRLTDVLSQGVKAGQFRNDLDISHTADIIHNMQLSCIHRIVTNDRLNPVNTPLIQSTINFIIHAVKSH